MKFAITTAFAFALTASSSVVSAARLSRGGSQPFEDDLPSLQNDGKRKLKGEDDSKGCDATIDCECTGAKSYEHVNFCDFYNESRRRRMEEGGADVDELTRRLDIACGCCTRKLEGETDQDHQARQLSECRRRTEETDEEFNRRLICRRTLEEGDEQPDQRKLGSPTGFSLPEWINEIERERPGCALAPVRSQEDLAFYSKLKGNCNGSGCETAVGIAQSPFQAYQCAAAIDALPESKEDEIPDVCIDGWINLIDGSCVPDDLGLWAEGRPKGYDYGKPYIYANLAYGSSPVLYDQCDDDGCNVFPYAVIECCERTTCYNQRNRRSIYI